MRIITQCLLVGLGGAAHQAEKKDVSQEFLRDWLMQAALFLGSTLFLWVHFLIFSSLASARTSPGNNNILVMIYITLQKRRPIFDYFYWKAAWMGSHDERGVENNL